MVRNFCFAVTVALESAALCAHASTVTIGAGTSANRYPFSPDYSGEYQQVYSASDFTGPVTITAITFFEAAGYSSFSGDYTLRLYTTSDAVNGLSNSLLANEGGTVGPVFASGTFTTTGSLLTFTATNPFSYDPSAGNLLLNVVKATATTGSDPFLAGVSADTSRIWGASGVAYSHDTTGLKTQFTYTPGVAVTPEPSTFMLLGTGLVFTATFARRRPAGFAV